MSLYTYKLCFLLELCHPIQIFLIRFTALAFILLLYFSIVTQMLSCTCSDRDLLQSLKGKAQPKWCLCKQVRDHGRKTNHKKRTHICTLTLRYPESVSKSASGVTVSKQDSKTLHLTGGFWEARLPRKS